MQLTNNSAFNKVLDDEYQSNDYQCKGYVEAVKVVEHLQTKIFKNLNDQELEEFRKEFAYRLDMTLK